MKSCAVVLAFSAAVSARSSIDPKFRLLIDTYEAMSCPANASLSTEAAVWEDRCWSSNTPFSSFKYNLRRLGSQRQYGDCSLTLYGDQACQTEVQFKFDNINDAEKARMCFSISDTANGAMPRPMSLAVRCAVSEEVEKSTDLVWWSCLAISVFLSAILFGLAIVVCLYTDWLSETGKSTPE